MKHTKKHRKQKGGYYGAAGAIAPGAMQWNSGSEMGGFTADQINAGAKFGGRRRKHKTRKSRRKTQRRKGGGKYGGVSASFGGDGVAGLANFKGASTRISGPGDVATFGKFNDNGAHPGNFSKFEGLLPK